MYETGLLTIFVLPVPGTIPVLHGMKRPNLLLGEFRSPPSGGTGYPQDPLPEGCPGQTSPPCMWKRCNNGISHLLSAGSERSRFRSRIFRSFSRDSFSSSCQKPFIRSEALQQFRLRTRLPPFPVFMEYGRLKEEHQIPSLSPQQHSNSHGPAEGCLSP